MKRLEIVARSQEDARARAAAKLGISSQQVHVLEEYEPDQVDLQTLEAEEAALPPEQRLPGEPVLYIVAHNPVENLAPVAEWIQGLVQRFQPGATVELVAAAEDVRAIIAADDPSIFIGRQGHTLAALQHIVGRIVPRLHEGCPAVHLDVGDYRDRKSETLRRIADQAVRRAKRSRQSVSLKPMPSPDRKFLHNYLKSVSGITTQSFGREPFRYLCIMPEGAIHGDEEDDNRGNRMDQPPHQGHTHGRGRERDAGRRGRGGRGRHGRGTRRDPEQRQAAHDPYAEERRKMREMAAAFEQNEAAEPSLHDFEDVGIEETPSRLMGYDENKHGRAPLDPNGHMVDEIE